MQSKPISWMSLDQQFCPNLGANLKSIIATVSKEAAPVELVGLKRYNIKKMHRPSLLKAMLVDLKQLN